MKRNKLTLTKICLAFPKCHYTMCLVNLTLKDNLFYRGGDVGGSE